MNPATATNSANQMTTKLRFQDMGVFEEMAVMDRNWESQRTTRLRFQDIGGLGVAVFAGTVQSGPLYICSI